MSKRPDRYYEFGPFRASVNDRLLLRDGQIVPLTPKAFDLLLALVENSGRVLSKDELMRQVWAESFVEEANLSRNVFTLRKALGEVPDQNQYIETIPKRGYRFVAPVKELRDGAADVDLAPRRTPGPGSEKEPPAASHGPKAQRRWGTGLTVLIISLIVAGLAIAVYHFAGPVDPKPSTSAASKSIAVLPFKIIGEEEGNQYLSLGMADALITKLSNIRRISVRPTAAVRKYTDLEQDPVVVGRELRVDSVLEGNIQKLGSRIRVTVQLVNIEERLPLWAVKFDEDFTEVFQVQDSISEKIIKALSLKLTHDEQELLVKRYTDNVQAYEFYLRGRSYLVSLTKEDTQKAMEAFESAILLDNNYAPAYAGLARASAQMRIRFASEAEIKGWAERAEREANQALRLDSELAEAHEALAAIYRYTEFNWERTIKESRLAIELNPNLDMPHTYLAGAFYHLGLLDMVDEEARHAMEINQANRVEPLRSQGIAALLGGRYAEAAQLLEQMQHLTGTPLSDTWLAQAYFYEGQRAKAEATLAQLSGSGQVERRAQATLASFLAARGNRAEAEALLRNVFAGSYMDHHVAYSVGVTYAQLHDYRRALLWLARAVDTGFLCYPWYEKDPLLQPLRGSTEFQHFIETLRKSWEGEKARYANP
jgi:DNA-binding winged helix-turn-helix (wHTH) protein/TolB-like protein